ncbi:MAG: AAA domain-containing protein [Filifactor alocis]|nr:AAA domain-containing protein [Filifactor alocis]
MDGERRAQVLEILDYWRLIEFLGQTDIPVQKNENKKLRKKLEKGEDVTETKLEVFQELSDTCIQVDEMIGKDDRKFTSFASKGEEVYFCMGAVQRNAFVEYLSKYLPDEEEAPELAYPDKSLIAWFSFKTNNEGGYLDHSFQLSPLLWAASVWEDSREEAVRIFYPSKDVYDSIVRNFNERLEGRSAEEFLPSLFEDIQTNYVKKSFPDLSVETKGFLEYNRYSKDEHKQADEDPTDYSDLGKSYFLNDINLLYERVRSGSFGDKNEYEKGVIDYILSAHNKSRGNEVLGRVTISPKEDQTLMRRFFEDVLDVDRAPIGKWPAKFMPALMQQVAINLSVDPKGKTPVFSVNGPPGTGKTTLLKEIVAHNIVERAKLLAEAGDDPDEIFEQRFFSHGSLDKHAYYQYAPSYYDIKNDKINDYAMLIASCNNAAVENITVDLPKSKDILESLKDSEEEYDSIREGLREVYSLFDLEQSDDIETVTTYGKSRQEKDIYFTRYAKKLLGMDDCWGLISAPFGKRANIRRYCTAVLEPFLEEYKSLESRKSHRKKYSIQRTLFLEQLEKVKEMQKELSLLCKLARKVEGKEGELDPDELLEKKKGLMGEISDLNREIKEAEKEVLELEEGYPRNWFGKRKKSSKRDSLIQKYRNKIDSLMLKKDEINLETDRIDRILKYRKLLKAHSEGEKMLTPLDSSFMDDYMSFDEKRSTRAQVSDPWFTPEYNREREKLFLHACKLHKEFAAASKALRHNIINLLIAWNMSDDCTQRMTEEDRQEAMPVLLQSIFLMTPVISTTFASAQTFLSDVGQSGVFGTLIIDEAGQAQPQMAIGSMFRCRKAVIVGDPKQIEPVVTAETDMIKQLLSSDLLSSYKDKKISVQGFADYINPYGTFLGEEEEKEWVGCPLVVHRRCIDPMYSISNILSYDLTMKQQTTDPKEERCKTFIADKSYWIDVEGSEDPGAKDHFVKAQGEVVIRLLEEKFKKDPGDIPRLFIITPFTSVKKGIRDMISGSQLYKKEPRIKKWMADDNIGTVHTFQGQGTDEVIFLLGCDKNSMSAANWVNKNIVNVAATRAKFRFYIVGDRKVWTCKPVKIAREYMGELIRASDLDKLLSEDTRIDENKKLVEAQGSESYTNDEKTSTTSSVCPKCGRALVKRKGKFGEFIGCSGFPKCKFTRSLEDPAKDKDDEKKNGG